MDAKPITKLPTECIEWAGAHTQEGYGQKRHNGKTAYSHRLAYCKHKAIDLSEIDGLIIRHDCDNPRCVNPEHMQTGTRTDNARDKVSRGRHLLNIQRGEQCHRAKLTKLQVEDIRKNCIPGSRSQGQSSFARKYGITSGAVCRIYRGKQWAETA